MAPTLYSYFKSKDELFEAYVRGECARFEDAIFNVNPDEAIDRRLTIIGQRFLERLLSERAVRTFQVVVAEAHWSPGLARAFRSRPGDRNFAVDRSAGGCKGAGRNRR